MLVVDDEPDIEMLIGQRFRKQIGEGDISFRFASNGFEGLRLLQEDETIDLLVTDLNMPEMDGLTLLREVKGLLREPILSVVVTAYGDMRNIRSAMNSGAFDFLTKPLDFQDFRTTLSRCSEEIHLMRSATRAVAERDVAVKERDVAQMEKSEAQQARQFKQQFLATMSHEIRTPMNAIIGLTNMLARRVVDVESQEKLQIIKQSGEHLLSIINDILDISKIEAGKMQIEHVPFDLPATLELVHSSLNVKAEEKGIELRVEVAGDIPQWVMGDSVRLYQVLINIASNAIKFTESGSVVIRCESKGERDGKHLLHFSVTDTGVGIPAEKLHSIFESFEQVSTDTTRKYGGTGLGLSIAGQLVKLHGGEIKVESTEGVGSTFSFEISMEEADAPQAAAGAAIGDAELHAMPIRILLVEDNAFNQMVAQDTIKDFLPMASVDIADNGKVALEKLAAADYDVVLMDIQMPEMDGLEATKAIRSGAVEGKKDIPILAMTAGVTPEEVQQCMESGMNDVIPKPFKESELLSKLANLVGQRNRVEA